MYVFLNELFHVGQMGGRVRSTGDGTFRVGDVAYFSHAMSKELHARFPLAQVDIESCTNSLGGFIIRVRTMPSSVRPYVMTSIILSVLVSVFMFTMDSIPGLLRRMLQG